MVAVHSQLSGAEVSGRGPPGLILQVILDGEPAVPPTWEEHTEQARARCPTVTMQDLLRQALISLWSLAARLTYPPAPVVNFMKNISPVGQCFPTC